MASLERFRATCYSRDGIDPDAVIAPPYDVIDTAERAVLAARSPYNSVHLELPEAPAGASVDAYEHAALLLRQWHRQGVVATAPVPGLAVYRMTYRDEHGARRSTTGVLGALGLDPDRRGDVLPHEQTIPKDRRDRLSLLRATRANLSPIWGLSLAAGLGELCASAAASPDPWRAVDDEGVVHERFAVREADVEAICALVASAPVLIADGHHRYETACAYLEESPGTKGSDAVLAYVVELSPPELSVRAIHRLVRGVERGAFEGGLDRWFASRPGPQDAQMLPAAMEEAGGLGLVNRDGTAVLVPRAELVASAEDDLDSSRLALVLSDLGVTDVGYQHGVDKVVDAVARGRADAGVLLRPVSVEQIAATAHGGRRMPPKTTFFAPKPRTGMVFRELDFV